MFEFIAVFDDACLDHLAEQVVSFAGTLTHTGKYGKTSVTFGDVVDEFLDQYRLAHTGSSEESDLTSLGIRLDQVNDLDTGKKHLVFSGEVLVGRGFFMNGISVLSGNFTQAIDSLSHDIEKTSLDVVSNRHGDGFAQVNGLGSAGKTIRRIHGNSTHGVFANMLLAFKHQLSAVRAVYFQCIINIGQ